MRSGTRATDGIARPFIRIGSALNSVLAGLGALTTVFILPTEATLRSVGTEFQVDGGTAVPVSRPAIAVDPSAGWVVVWTTGRNVIGQRYDHSGQALGGEFVASSDTSAFHIKPAVATDTGGGFIVVWESFVNEPSDYVIRGRRYDAGGAAVGSEFLLDSAATDRQHRPVVATFPEGGFVVVWEGHDVNHFSGIFAQRYDDRGRPIGEEFRVNRAASGSAASPAVATDSSGNLIVAWAGDGDGDNTVAIFGQRYDAAGAAIGGEMQVSEPASGWESAPAVATDEAGGFVVVWRRADLFFGQVVGRRYDSGGIPAGDVFPVTTTTRDYSYVSPTIAILPDGDFVVVSERDDLSQLLNGPGDIVAQQFRPDGAPEGGELLLNGVVAGHQTSPAVTTDGDGNVIVVWMTLAGIESEAGIFGRRYSASPLGERTGCACDCDDDHDVTVAELVRGVKLVLDGAPSDTCLASDADGDGRVTISDLLAAVDDALHGCTVSDAS